MPTENRSSNTEQMVSVPRDEVERLVKLLQYQAHPSPSPHAEFWQGLLDAPAAQHQVDMIEQQKNLIVSLRAELAESHRIDAQHQGEPVANRWEQLGGQGYCYGENLPAIFLGAWQELYTHPPTADVASAEQMAIQGTDGYRNGIKAAAELAADYPELAQAIRDLPLPQ
ncbi:hypothetical protein D9M71_678850 [compost metagenome]